MEKQASQSSYQSYGQIHQGQGQTGDGKCEENQFLSGLDRDVERDGLGVSG